MKAPKVEGPISTNEVAERLKVSKRHVHRLANSHKPRKDGARVVRVAEGSFVLVWLDGDFAGAILRDGIEMTAKALGVSWHDLTKFIRGELHTQGGDRALRKILGFTGYPVKGGV